MEKRPTPPHLPPIYPPAHTHTHVLFRSKACAEEPLLDGPIKAGQKEKTRREEEEEEEEVDPKRSSSK